jgi:hypothetical protein
MERRVPGAVGLGGKRAHPRTPTCRRARHRDGVQTNTITQGRRAMRLKPRLEDAATLRSGGAIRRNQAQLECQSDLITDQSRTTCVDVSGAT